MTYQDILRRRLARQGLTERMETPEDVMRRLFAIQSQYDISLIPALYARAENVTAKKVRKLLKEKTFYKTWSVRQTLHAHACEDHGLITHAVGGFFGPFYRQRPPSPDLTWLQIEELMTEALSAGPLTREDLHERVPVLQSVEHAGWGRDVKSLAYAGKLYMTEQGASRSKFGLVDFQAEPQDMAELLRRYIKGHGPIAKSDFKYWTGMYAYNVVQAWETVMPELVELQVEGKTYYDFPDEPEGEPPKIRLLAKFDPYILGWKDKSFIREPKAILRPAGQIESSVLLGTDLAATYRIVGGKSIDWFPIRKLTGKETSLMEAEGKRLLKALSS